MELINLNNGDAVAIGKLPYGTTRDIPIKLGNKLYLLDVQKQATGACIDFYRRVNADRKKFSKLTSWSWFEYVHFPVTLFTPLCVFLILYHSDSFKSTF